MWPNMRHFYRCTDCLSVVATVEPIRTYTDARGFTRYGLCSACDGRIEYMGHVTRDRLVRTSEACACDGRCTNATGPSCDCQCGGENHGSGRTVTVEYDAGGVPRVNVPPDAVEKAQVYRALVDRFTALWGAQYRAVTERKRYERLNGTAYSLYLEGLHAWQAFSVARNLRSHAGRNKRIAALLNRATEGVAA
jgi:hypothetical protein